MYTMTSDQTEILKKLTDIVQKSIVPHAIETDANGTFPQASIQALADAGYFGLTLPNDVGGMASRRASSWRLWKRLLRHAHRRR